MTATMGPPADFSRLPETSRRDGAWSRLRAFSPRQWVVALVAGSMTAVITAIPTAMIPTPLFTRDVPTTAWAWPVLILTSILAGLLLATYVGRAGGAADEAAPGRREGRLGALGAFVTFFAVGCPVCNKIVLLALGYSGAMQYFAPVQPVLAATAVAALAAALWLRLRRLDSCRVSPAAARNPAPRR